MADILSEIQVLCYWQDFSPYCTRLVAIQHQKVRHKYFIYAVPSSLLHRRQDVQVKIELNSFATVTLSLVMLISFNFLLFTLVTLFFCCYSVQQECTEHGDVSSRHLAISIKGEPTNSAQQLQYVVELAQHPMSETYLMMRTSELLTQHPEIM